MNELKTRIPLSPQALRMMLFLQRECRADRTNKISIGDFFMISKLGLPVGIGNHKMLSQLQQECKAAGVLNVAQGRKSALYTILEAWHD